ncbi:hypothetical protein EG343_03425 [Chryseobacterium nakagawai]|uniref:Uncharacterized protein n=1 Tax=Chryseobacterium nakagawai TaxID=1241982 RepID=A0AAD0YJK1_CHRNA|nr:hypothetical protein EG343_03425 [Chryseobacterium nakagawai]
MLYFGDYGTNHAKMIPLRFLIYLKPTQTNIYHIDFLYFKLIIYSYSKIKRHKIFEIFLIKRCLTLLCIQALKLIHLFCTKVQIKK